MNNSESNVAADLRAEGWEVLRDGWPDFLCYRWVDGKREIKCVEVKDKATRDRLSKKQIDVHAVLNSAGLPVEVVGDTGGPILRRRQRVRALAQSPEWRRKLLVGCARRDGKMYPTKCAPEATRNSPK